MYARACVRACVCVRVCFLSFLPSFLSSFTGAARHARTCLLRSSADTLRLLSEAAHKSLQGQERHRERTCRERGRGSMREKKSKKNKSKNKNRRDSTSPPTKSPSSSSRRRRRGVMSTLSTRGAEALATVLGGRAICVRVAACANLQAAMNARHTRQRRRCAPVEPTSKRAQGTVRRQHREEVQPHKDNPTCVYANQTSHSHTHTYTHAPVRTHSHTCALAHTHTHTRTHTRTHTHVCDWHSCA